MAQERDVRDRSRGRGIGRRGEQEVGGGTGMSLGAFEGWGPPTQERLECLGEGTGDM